MSKKKKKTNLRSRTKYAALNPNLNLKTRYDEITDILSYADTLSEKDKAWLNTFAEEYIGAKFNHGKKHLHKTKKDKKKCYDRNNARNRDIYTKAKATGTTVSFNNISEKDEAIDKVNEIVDIIDLKRNINSWDDGDKD